MEDNTPIADFEQTRKAAENTLKQLMNGQLLNHDNAQLPQFLNADVSIDTGLDRFNNAEQDNESIRLTINTPAVEQFQDNASEVIKKTIQNIPFIDEWVRARSEEDEIHYVREKLGKLKDAGAAIPESIFKWAGLDTRNEARDEVPDHLISTDSSTYSTTVSLQLPKHLPEDMAADDIAASIKQHLADIKEVLAKRIAKYQHLDIESIRQQVDALEFTVKSDNGNVSGDQHGAGQVHIIIQSPEQKEVFDAMDIKDMAKAEFDADLTHSNIIQQLDAEHINKVISGALQQAGDEQHQHRMAEILGTQDVLHKLTKTLKHFEEKHPDQAHQIADVLNSSIFRISNWQDESKSDHFIKHPLVIRKEADSEKRGQMMVDMVVPKGQSSKIIEKLAAMSPTQQFAQVDSIEVKKAVSDNPKVSAAMNRMLSSIIDQPMTPEESADTMKPYAEKLVELVEDMFKDKSEAMAAHTDNDTIKKSMLSLLDKVDAAHQTVVDGIKTGAKQAASAIAGSGQAATQAAQAHDYANPKDNAPSPIVSNARWAANLAQQSQPTIGA